MSQFNFLDEKDYNDVVKFRGQEIDQWGKKKVEFVPSDKQDLTRDFQDLGLDSLPVLSNNAYQGLRESFEQCGQFLKLDDHGVIVWFYNCTTIFNCIDYERSDLIFSEADDGIIWINTLVVDGTKVESGSGLIFRVQGVETFGLVVNELMKQKIESLELSGIRFVELS